MISKAIKKAYDTAVSRGWDTMYWAVDLHETIMRPTHSKEPSTEFYDGAVRVLKTLTERPDQYLILYTSSHDDDVIHYLGLLRAQGVLFDYVNENPSVLNNAYGCFDRKFYFNVLVDDKAGFDPESDWEAVERVLKTLPVLALKEE